MELDGREVNLQSDISLISIPMVLPSGLITLILEIREGTNFPLGVFSLLEGNNLGPHSPLDWRDLSFNTGTMGLPLGACKRPAKSS